MKIWMVMVILGKVGATWGPLPYSMEACEERRLLLEAEIDIKFKPLVVEGVRLKRSDISYHCTDGDRPQLDDKW